MRQMFLLFSHNLTPAQIEDAKKNWNITHFIPLPNELQELWSNIPPDCNDIEKFLEPIYDWLIKNSKQKDLALIQGDFGATCKIASFAKKIGLIPVYATTKRNAIEKIIDGKVVKTSTFEHIMYRKF